MAQRKQVGTTKLQLTIDETTDRIIGEMVKLGIHGPTKAEVASWILRSWLWSSQDQLKLNGISLNTPKES